MLIALAIGALGLRTHHQSTKQGLPAITHSTSKPSESKEDADAYQWQGSANDPKKLIIDKLAVDTYIQRMGVDQNKEIAVPTNVHLAGWFINSAQPGQKGLSIIDGHVTGRNSPGVFKGLHALSKNDTFQIIRGDDTVLQYKVVDIKKVSEREASQYVFSQDPRINSQVNLVTCAGVYDQSSGRFPDRIVVSAQLLPLS